MKRRLSRSTIRCRAQDHWQSLLPDLYERTLQSLLPELREYAIHVLLHDAENWRMQYSEAGYPTLSRQSLSNMQRLERMGIAGCKLAVAANSSKIDFESLRELLVELLPFLWSTILHDTAVETIRTEFDDRFGDKIDEIRQYIEENPFSSDSNTTRARTNTQSSNNLNRLREKVFLRIPTSWGAI